jgi:exodeoxyribonuclease V beta subunit
MADLVGGTAFGSLVHSVFEYADPRDRDQLAGVVRRATARAGLAGVDEATLLAALEPGLTTPLGPITDNLSLADIGLADRLAELDFELPLAAGADAGPVRRPATLAAGADAQPAPSPATLAAGADSGPARRPATLADVADALDRHVPPDDPLAPYAGRLRSAGLGDQALLGFLTGSIDVVLRVGDPSRHIVVDYKTNRLAPPGQPLTLRLYTPARLAQAMMASHYPLQALLYCVALHRFLRWRQPGYDPAAHLGGVAYLFVRGLAGPATPLVDGEPTGVFAWRPPVALIEDLDALLAGRPT